MTDIARISHATSTSIPSEAPMTGPRIDPSEYDGLFVKTWVDEDNQIHVAVYSSELLSDDRLRAWLTDLTNKLETFAKKDPERLDRPYSMMNLARDESTILGPGFGIQSPLPNEPKAPLRSLLDATLDDLEERLACL